MDKKIIEIAKEAGFCLWGDESWNPGDVVDWNCRYDAELEKFAKLIVEDCIRTIQEQIETNGPTPSNLRSFDHIDDIALKYGIKFPIPY